jgi:hypothetical protein
MRHKRKTDGERENEKGLQTGTDRDKTREKEINKERH